MRRSNFALRLQPSLLKEARKIAEAEGVALNQLINVAVAEKVSALRTESYLRERAVRGDVRKALGILKRAGAGNPPIPGDERKRPQRAAGSTLKELLLTDRGRGEITMPPRGRLRSRRTSRSP